MLQYANGEFISIIAMDDFLIRNTLKEKMEYFNKDKNLAFVCDSKIRVINEFGEEIEDYPKMPLNDIEKPTINDILNLDFNELHSFYIQGTIFKRSLIDAVNGFDNDMICDDIIIRTKVARYLSKHKNLNFKVLHKESVNYRRHSNNVSSNTLRQCRGVIEFLKRYYPNKKPPLCLKDWIFNCAAESKENEIALLEYTKKTKYKNLYYDYIKGIYKILGVPFLFQIKNYKDKTGKKTKFLTVLGVRIKIKG